MSALLAVQNLTKRFGRRVVVDGVSFEIEPDEILGVVEPSGSGKSISYWPKAIATRRLLIG